MTAIGLRRLDRPAPRPVLRRVSAMNFDTPEDKGALRLFSLGDGRRVLVRDWTGRLLVCDVAAGAVLSRSLALEKAAPYTGALVPGSERAIGVGRQRIDVLDAADLARPLRSIAWDGGYPWDVAAHPDGRRVAVLHHSGLDVWDVATGARIARMPREALATRVVGDAAGAYLYASNGSDSRAIVAWTWDGARVGDVAYGNSPVVDGDRLVAERDGNLAVWNVRPQAAPRHPPVECASNATFACATFAVLDGRRAVAVGHNCELTLWDLDAALPLAARPDARRFQYAVAVGLSATRFVLATRRCTLEVWEVGEGGDDGDDAAGRVRGRLGYADLVPVGEGAVLARGLCGGGRVVDLVTGATRAPELPPDVRAVRDVLYADERVVLHDHIGRVVRSDRASGARVELADGARFDGPEIAVARGGELVAGVIRVEVPLAVDERVPQEDRDDHSDERTPVLVLVDRAGADPRAYRPLGDAPAAFAFAGPAGEVLVAVAADGAVTAWRTADGARLATFECAPCEALVASERWFATRGAGGGVRTFDLATGAPLAALEGAFVALALGRDGAELVTASAGGEVACWDPRAGARLAAYDTDAPIRALFADRSGLVAWVDPSGALRRLARI